ncbi:Bacterial SH3 domain protein (plasmid) [Sulfitobacter sp. THAF37]|uniref:SH3 domain-containing protein n=1 Tax=Sulfitobacter sp. THAF37 TaxID=2587855 RepID=UPI0012682A38|nr:SH3 domain-containing protein [Sulfitobacter sp. THAF37]QFT61128.1 Bacterial SH3 domain protein [Sulfitobacter sp. THAF37]
MQKTLISLAVLGALASTASAQNIVVPGNRGPTDTGCLIKGLDPNGDGFLALRTGPGSKYQQIGSLYNGDAAFVYGGQGNWLYVENGARNGKAVKFRGWIYDAWCEFYP